MRKSESCNKRPFEERLYAIKPVSLLRGATATAPIETAGEVAVKGLALLLMSLFL